MDNNMDFINADRRHWGKIYTDVAYAISEISPFVSERDLNIRKYVEERKENFTMKIVDKKLAPKYRTLENDKSNQEITKKNPSVRKVKKIRKR